jgi:hypothetical protein
VRQQQATLRPTYDLYVHTVWEVPVDFRRTLLGESAGIDNRFWVPGDEWSDPSTGTHIDIMYRSPAWIEGQIERILSRHEASLGYTTCFWYDIVTSARLRSKRCFGWRAFVSASCSAGGGQGGWGR